MAFSVEPLAELEDLEARLEFDLDDDKMRELGRSALEDATVPDCRHRTNLMENQQLL